jgi:hypothetical protein
MAAASRLPLLLAIVSILLLTLGGMLGLKGSVDSVDSVLASTPCGPDTTIPSGVTVFVFGAAPLPEITVPFTFVLGAAGVLAWDFGASSVDDEHAPRANTPDNPRTTKTLLLILSPG